jgi:hypothetical protein
MSRRNQGKSGAVIEKRRRRQDMKGIVSSVRPTLRNQRLKVVARVTTDKGEVHEAFMPDREVSAILPRSILLGAAKTAPPVLLGTIQPILARMAEGRAVRLWKYQERFFFSFLPWKSVRFIPPDGLGTPTSPPPRASGT